MTSAEIQNILKRLVLIALVAGMIIPQLIDIMRLAFN